MIFDILFYILIGFAILAVIVCHFLWNFCYLPLGR